MRGASIQPDGAVGAVWPLLVVPAPASRLSRSLFPPRVDTRRKAEARAGSENTRMATDADKADRGGGVRGWRSRHIHPGDLHGAQRQDGIGMVHDGNIDLYGVRRQHSIGMVCIPAIGVVRNGNITLSWCATAT